jgi:hypothetical protein
VCPYIIWEFAVLCRGRTFGRTTAVCVRVRVNCLTNCVSLILFGDFFCLNSK